MGIINGPKPSEPKSPTGDQSPLQPGGTVSSNPLHSQSGTRVMPEAPEVLREEFQDVDDAAQRNKR